MLSKDWKPKEKLLDLFRVSQKGEAYKSFTLCIYATEINNNICSKNKL